MSRVDADPAKASRIRGWLPLFLLSWGLGLSALRRRVQLRQAVVRIVVPLDPSRFLELPHTIRAVAASPGERVIDLASPKLAAVAIGRSGAHVTSVDQFEREVETWTEIAGDRPGVEFVCADGRALPFGDESFDHAFSISVLEHIPADGDELALAELARVVKPGGRVVLTMPFAGAYHEDWRNEPLYDDEGNRDDGPHFFERWYDQQRIEQLLAAAPALREVDRSIVSLDPDLHRAYTRSFPWLIPFGLLFGLLARERPGPPGDVVRLTLTKAG